MRVTFYGYNSFVLEGQEKTLIVDPGRNLHWRRLNSLIPRGLWSEAGVILVTHGDADHAEYVPRVAEASGAPIACGPALAQKFRRKGLAVVQIGPGEGSEVAGLEVQGVRVQHGPAVSVLGRRVALKPDFVGPGAVGLLFGLDGQRLLNLGDTLLLEDAWRALSPDVLMIPVGGVMTMDVDQALRAVAAIEPQIVIPTHYGWSILFYRHRADVGRFAAGVEGAGRRCFPLKPGQSAEL